jgi:hypothetical protein
MSLILLAVPLFVAFFGLVVFAGGVGHLARGRAGKGGRNLIGGAIAAVLGTAFGLIGFNAQTYSRLVYESPVAEVTVHAIDSAALRYRVTVHRLDGSNRSEDCELQGDEWLISGRVQKWQPWANVIGMNATYSLDQLSNRYTSSARGDGKPITSCDLGGPTPIINQYVPAWVMDWLISHSYVQDRRFGDANYMPLADGAVYHVVITQSGFNSEPANDAGRKANDGEH